jgi:hypothetical protein
VSLYPEAVTARQQWRHVAADMGFPEHAMRTHTSLSFHLRALYVRAVLSNPVRGGGQECGRLTE